MNRWTRESARDKDKEYGGTRKVEKTTTTTTVACNRDKRFSFKKEKKIQNEPIRSEYSVAYYTDGICFAFSPKNFKTKIFFFQKSIDFSYILYKTN